MQGQQAERALLSHSSNAAGGPDEQAGAHRDLQGDGFRVSNVMRTRNPQIPEASTSHPQKKNEEKATGRHHHNIAKRTRGHSISRGPCMWGPPHGDTPEYKTASQNRIKHRGAIHTDISKLNTHTYTSVHMHAHVCTLVHMHSTHWLLQMSHVQRKPTLVTLGAHSDTLSPSSQQAKDRSKPPRREKASRGTVSGEDRECAFPPGPTAPHSPLGCFT